MSSMNEFETAKEIGKILDVPVSEGSIITETNLRFMLALAKKIESLSEELATVKIQPELKQYIDVEESNYGFGPKASIYRNLPWVEGEE